MIEIRNGRIYVEGVETIDPELIGFAVLDMLEKVGGVVNGTFCISETDPNGVSTVVQICKFENQG